MTLTLRLIGLAGVLVFGLAFALTFLSPIHVERAARGFIQDRIERQVSDRLGLVQEARQTRVGRLAGAIAARNKEEIGALRERLASGLNARIAAEVGRMQDLSCECREILRRGLDAATEARLSHLERAQPQLRRIIAGRYAEIVADLLRDLRIFSGTNLLAFVLLLVLSITKPDRTRQLFVPGVLLGAAAVSASAVYLLGQDWFFTLLHGDFVGWTYAIWLLLIYALFCDITLFKAWITSRILSALGASPC